MRSPTTLRSLLAGICAASAFSTACSLTYQSLYEGDVRFEHCYRLDEEKQVPVVEKQRCWHDWTQKQTYGQARERVDYALVREPALARTQESVETATALGRVLPNRTFCAP